MLIVLMIINSSLLKETAGHNQVKLLHIFTNMSRIAPQSTRVYTSNLRKSLIVALAREIKLQDLY